MIQWLLLGVNALLLIAVVASGICWFRILRRRQGSPLREKIESLMPSRVQERPRDNNFDGLAVFVTALVMLFTMTVAFRLIWVWMVQNDWIELVDSAWKTEPTSDASPGNETAVVLGGPAEHRTADSVIASIVAHAGAGTISVLVSIGWLGLFFRHPFRVLGFWPSPRDVWLGLRASLLILPPVLLISAAASQLIRYEHPVLNSLEAFPLPGVFLATILATAVITPVVEEWLVRGLLQGGLQRLADPPEAEQPWRPVSFWPLIGASAIFAFMHFGQGAAPIPLFFLSLGLGYLYRQTGNLTACVVVHMVLNSLTLLVEILKAHS